MRVSAMNFFEGVLQTCESQSGNRSAAVVSDEASQCQGAGGSDSDPRASRAGAFADRANQHGSGTSEELRRATARLQPAECESGESPGTESGAAGRAGTAAGSDRGAQRTNLRIQPADREDRQGELSAGGTPGTGEGSGD